MWPALYLPKGEPKFEKLDYWSTDLAKLIQQLQAEDFSGYVEILSPHQHGLFIFSAGRLHSCFYDGTEELQLADGQILAHFLHKKRRGPETLITAAFLPPDIIEALGGLVTRRPLYRELETSFLDMNRLFATLGAKHFTGVLRFYQIRSHTRLGNILIKMNKISRDQLQQAVRLQLSQKGGLRLGDALVEIGAISAQDLESALSLQTHARKGSDVEIALAIFMRGDLLGGYSYLHKQFNRNRDEILPQMVGTEVLMDIIDGNLPDPIDLQPVLNQGAQPPAAAPPEKPREPDEAVLAGPGAAQPAAPRPPAAEPMSGLEDSVMVLHGSDLLMDLSADGEPAPAGQPAEAEPIPVAPAQAVTAPEPPAPAEAPGPESSDREPEPAEAQSFRIPEEVQGLDYVAAVMGQFMGPLAKKLLEREIKALGFPGRLWNNEQILELGWRLEKSSGRIMGKQQARKLVQKINERLP